MAEQQHIGPVLPGGVDGGHGGGLDVAGVAVQHEDADALYLQQALRLPGLAPVAVAGNHGHRQLGELPLQRLSVPDAVPQMQHLPGVELLHGPDHVIHPAVGIGKNQNLHEMLLWLLDFQAQQPEQQRSQINAQNIQKDIQRVEHPPHGEVLHPLDEERDAQCPQQHLPRLPVPEEKAHG